MNARDEDQVDEEVADETSDEFEEDVDGGDDDEALPDEDLEAFEGDAEDDEDDDSLVDISDKEKPSREQSARALEIRRAIEARREERQLHEEVDYLDFDFDE